MLLQSSQGLRHISAATSWVMIVQKIDEIRLVAHNSDAMVVRESKPVCSVDYYMSSAAEFQLPALVDCFRSNRKTRPKRSSDVCEKQFQFLFQDTFRSCIDARRWMQLRTTQTLRKKEIVFYPWPKYIKRDVASKDYLTNPCRKMKFNFRGIQ